jgi:predicted DNA-binding transcriptional regulator AlpA
MKTDAAGDSRVRALTRTHLRALKGIEDSNSTLLRKEKRGEFPIRFYLGARKAVWLESDIDQWILDQKHKTQNRANSITAAATMARAENMATRRRRLAKNPQRTADMN